MLNKLQHGLFVKIQKSVYECVPYKTVIGQHNSFIVMMGYTLIYKNEAFLGLIGASERHTDPRGRKALKLTLFP